MVIEVVRIAPHLVAQLRAGQHTLGVRGEDRQEVELGHGQGDLLVAHLDAPRSVVDLKRTNGEYALSPTAGFGQGRAPEVRVDPRGEDARVERLGDVVVRADLQTNYLVHLCGAAGEHDHGARDALTSQLANDVRAADVGEHPVDQTEVGVGAGGELDGLRAGAGLHDVMALQAAHLGDQHADRHVVLDDEDSTSTTGWRCGQLRVGGANPTRRCSRTERFGRRIRSTRLSPPSITSVSSHPSGAAS